VADEPLAPRLQPFHEVASSNAARDAFEDLDGGFVLSPSSIPDSTLDERGMTL
jgi:hypothetical protein